MGRRVRGSAEDAPKAEEAAPAPEPASVAVPVEVKAAEFSVEKKIAEIKASSLPEAEKEVYILRLTGGVSTEVADRVPFTVYANIKSIGREKRAGMLGCQKAKGVTAATLVEWDEIFKDF